MFPFVSFVECRQAFVVANSSGIGLRDYGGAALPPVEEQRIPTIAFDRRSIRQPEALARVRLDRQPLQDLAWNERVHRPGIDQKIDGDAPVRLYRIRQFNGEDGEPRGAL